MKTENNFNEQILQKLVEYNLKTGELGDFKTISQLEYDIENGFDPFKIIDIQDLLTQ